MIHFRHDIFRHDMADVEAQKSVEADPILPHKRKRYLVYRTVRAAHRFAVGDAFPLL